MSPMGVVLVLGVVAQASHGPARASWRDYRPLAFAAPPASPSWPLRRGFCGGATAAPRHPPRRALFAAGGAPEDEAAGRAAAAPAAARATRAAARAQPAASDDAPDGAEGDDDAAPGVAIPSEPAEPGEPQAIDTRASNITIATVLKELASIQQNEPSKIVILGTRHCSFVHQQIIELLGYALVLTGNEVLTSGSVGTNAAAIRGALRAGQPDLLTVVLPQSLEKQSDDSQELLRQVENVVENPQNDELPLDVASRKCNSERSRRATSSSRAFHASGTVLEAARGRARRRRTFVARLRYLD